MKENKRMRREYYMPMQVSNSHIEHSITVNHTTIHFLLGRDGPKTDEPQSKQDLPFYTHTHAYGELFFCLTDTARIQLEQTCAILSAGDILYVPPNVRHICETMQINDNYFCIGIRLFTKDSRDFIRHLEPLFHCHHPLILRTQSDTVSAWHALLHDIAHDDSDLSALRLLTQLTQLVRCGFSELPLPPASSVPDSAGSLARIAELEFLIDACFMTRLTREDVAARLYISKRQLDRICQKRFGKTFHEQIEEKRLTVAMHMLKETDHTAETISRMVGFSSKSSFYQAFNRKFGMTPHEYRRKSRRLL